MGGVRSAVTFFVVGIFEGMPGVVVDLDLNFLSQSLGLLSKLVHVVRSNAVILASENPQDWSVARCP